MGCLSKQNQKYPSTFYHHILTISTSLFRAEAQNAQGTKVMGDVVLVHPISLTFLTTLVISMALSVVLLFALGSYTRRTTVEGELTPDTGLVKIYAAEPGIVLKSYVFEGQHVARGQILYTVSTDLQSESEGQTEAALIEQTRQRKASLQQEIDRTRLLQSDERCALGTKIDELRRELSGIDGQLAD